ncbi:hypothetical protein ACFWCA_19630 [Streptomyces phaeochromogenes]|uniref:hypothetical protein n=1 Tax=Streptomyces phaeochromogenes TaxID=1923 RepID=UPI0036AF31CB
MTTAQVAAEIKRLSAMDEDTFMRTVVAHVMGETDPKSPRDIQAEAQKDPLLAVQTMDALQLAFKRARTFMPRLAGESKAEQAVRMVPFKARLREAAGVYQEVVDDLAHLAAKELAALDDAPLAELWTSYILNEPITGQAPRRVLALAFRSPRVAPRVEGVCRLMHEAPEDFLPPATPGQSKRARTAQITEFRREVGSEARFLRYAVQYAAARHGEMPAEPNVRLQAYRRLGEKYPQELSAFIQQIREELKLGKMQTSSERRAVRRAMRDAK